MQYRAFGADAAAAGHGSCKNGALYRGLRPDSEARACKRVSGLDGLRIRVRHPVALVRVAVLLGAVLFALLCVLPVGDGISTYNAARVQAGTLDPDVMEQELRPLV